jgi:hypothetical protein
MLDGKQTTSFKTDYKVYLRHNITPDDISVLRRVEVGAGIPSRELNADKKWLDNCLSNTIQEAPRHSEWVIRDPFPWWQAG